MMGFAGIPNRPILDYRTEPSPVERHRVRSSTVNERLDGKDIILILTITQRILGNKAAFRFRRTSNKAKTHRVRSTQFQSEIAVKFPVALVVKVLRRDLKYFQVNIAECIETEQKRMEKPLRNTSPHMTVRRLQRRTALMVHIPLPPSS